MTRRSDREPPAGSGGGTAGGGGAGGGGLDAAERHYLTNPNLLKDFDPLARAIAFATKADGALILLQHREDGALPVEGAAGLERLTDRAAVVLAARALASKVIRAGSEAGGSEAGLLLLSVPVTLHGRTAGAIVLFGGWSEASRPILVRAAAIVARLAHSRLLIAEREDLRRRLNDLETERRRLAPLADLGASTRDLAGATVRALADVLAFGRRVARDIPSPDLNREYLEALVTEVERLERLWSEQVELASLGSAHLAPSDLNELVEEIESAAAERITKRKGRIIRRLAAGLPPLLLDVGRLHRVLERIMDSLLETLPLSGRIKIETRRAGDQVQVHLAADGPRRPGETLDRLFVAFSDAAHPGRGPLGAAVRQIVHDHGGEIGVRADAEWPLLYVLTLPIRGNQERRRPTPDRRDGRDRRAA